MITFNSKLLFSFGERWGLSWGMSLSPAEAELPTAIIYDDHTKLTNFPLSWKHILATFGLRDCLNERSIHSLESLLSYVLCCVLRYSFLPFSHKKTSILCHYHKFIQFNIISITRKAAQRAINFSKRKERSA